ncbi:MAG: transposase [Candidatus Bathyarchaeota archaeon]|nr:transposase [Candidatus Bathyarchaeota archaeon]
MPPVKRNNPVRARTSDSQYSLMEFMREYPDDATCLDWLWRNRYSEDGEHAYCPKCEQIRVFKRYQTAQQRQSWTCNGCGYHIHPTAGTIFHKSSTSLHLWFYAMYLMTSTRCGISAKQLERELGVTYKTAWRIAKEIRQTLMEQNDEQLGDNAQVELDETFVGGAEKGYNHERVTHSAHVYVSGDVHTNTIEGFWSLVKRGIGGVYHAVSSKHLQGYLNEYVWRYNHRDGGRKMFEALLLRVVR